ncbi:hypothetical protein K504DRAFT_453786 [Pleomassaria siparia CBS 279.74]|uniref:DUF7730 domain-containing protein n=1 Tax=Pleomassaria siparia CBS 279.74 TaxID=1314801 RepID=A0A6G1KE19_9PLEO|nr:hypothetical protein K504DRAFT_453786 [Pleomassaria siparia CBS 279.74]
MTSIAVGVVCGPILCIWITVASCFCPSRPNRNTESPEKKRFERRQKMAPRPLAKRAPNHRLSISFPLPDTNKRTVVNGSYIEKTTRGPTIDQTLTPLMRLPMELRQMIYRYVLGDSTMHMVLKEQKLGHLRCKAESTITCPMGYNGLTLSRECCWGKVDSANIWSPQNGNKEEPTDGGIVPLLRSCRQIYSESIKFLYSTNAFSFSDLDALRYFSCTVLPQRFNLIQNLDIEWAMAWPIYDPIAQQLLLVNPALYPPNDEATWEETWRIISNMPNLRVVRVSLLYFDGFRDTACEEKMLAPLRKVTRPETFEVHVSWQGQEITDAPFDLTRDKSDIDSERES